MIRQLLLILIVLINTLFVKGNTDKYRLIINNDPSSTLTIGWNQVSGNSPILYYGSSDAGTNFAAYPYQKLPDRIVSCKNLSNNFARLTNLLPNTIYYFVIHDSQGTSNRFWFKTVSNNYNDTLSMIYGGDSRTDNTVTGCRLRRQNGNKMVSKIRPSFVAFGGDFTLSGTNSQWSDWFDDWQLSTGSDGRMIPIIVALGNHDNFNDLNLLFDTPTVDDYYAININNKLIRFYCLNSEYNGSYVTATDAQTNWLRNDINTNSNIYSWMFAMYHEPMVSHSSYHSGRKDEADIWGPLFNNKVRLSMEAHAHTVKQTWPIIRTDSSGNDNGFMRDDINGTVYIGDGTWGAPLYPIDKTYAWTRNSGSFGGFQWIIVNKYKTEIRTIDFANVDQVQQVNDNKPFTAPAGINIWTPSKGSVVEITNNIYTNVGSNKSVQQEELIRKIYPNPAGNKKEFIVELNKYNDKSSIELIDSSGKTLVHKVLEKLTDKYILNLSEVSAGNYIVKVSQGNKTANRKLIIEK